MNKSSCKPGADWWEPKNQTGKFFNLARVNFVNQPLLLRKNSKSTGFYIKDSRFLKGWLVPRLLIHFVSSTGLNFDRTTGKIPGISVEIKKPLLYTFLIFQVNLLQIESKKSSVIPLTLLVHCLAKSFLFIMSIQIQASKLLLR